MWLQRMIKSKSFSLEAEKWGGVVDPVLCYTQVLSQQGCPHDWPLSLEIRWEIISGNHFWLRQELRVSLCPSLWHKVLSLLICGTYLWAAFTMTSWWLHDDFMMTLSIQRALKEHSENNQRAREQSDFIIPSETKVLRLVKIHDRDAEGRSGEIPARRPQHQPQDPAWVSQGGRVLHPCCRQGLFDFKF